MTAWSEEDIRVASVLEAGLGPVHVVDVISHPRENRMTVETTPYNETTPTPPGADPWADDSETGTSYPEVHRSLADHLYTWSPKLPDGSMMVVRAMSADELVRAVEDLAPVAARLRAAWQGVVGTQGAAPAPMGGGFQGPGQGVNFNPQMPPPNQPFQGQPAWQQAGAPMGGGFQAPQAPNVPQGWYKLNVPFKPSGNNPGKPGFDAIVQQYGFRKGAPSSGGQLSFQKEVKSWFCAPDIAQAFAVFSPVIP